MLLALRWTAILWFAVSGADLREASLGRTGVRRGRLRTGVVGAPHVVLGPQQEEGVHRRGVVDPEREPLRLPRPVDPEEGTVARDPVRRAAAVSLAPGGAGLEGEHQPIGQVAASGLERGGGVLDHDWPGEDVALGRVGEVIEHLGRVACPRAGVVAGERSLRARHVDHAVLAAGRVLIEAGRRDGGEHVGRHITRGQQLDGAVPAGLVVPGLCVHDAGPRDGAVDHGDGEATDA